MKTLKFFMLGLLICLTPTVYAQNILEGKAFNRMIIQDITFAIAGEATPVTGIKVDISKPEGTISGMFPIKNKNLPFDIFSFELKGGVADKSFSLLKGEGYPNSAYEFKPSFHIFTGYNSAMYGLKSENRAKKALVGAANDLTDAEMRTVLDTIYVVALLYNHHLKVLNDAKPLPPEIKSITENHHKIAAKLIPKLINRPDLNIDPKQDWIDILANLPQVTVIKDTIDLGTYYDSVVKMFKKYEVRYEGWENEKLDKKIKNSESIWTRKKYFWFTVSPVLRTDKANEYYTKFDDKDSLYFKSGFRWSVGGSLNANWYWVTPNKTAVLLRGTFSVMKTNNLSNLSSYNYETRSTIFAQGPALTEKSKTGTAYNNADIQNGYEKQLSAELYILPLKSFVPGGYFSVSLSTSELYNLPTTIGRGDDNFKAAIEGGVVFNINNRDKDKTLVSIIPYIRYEDLTDKLRTPIKTGIPETLKDFQDRNMFLGIKVGIPINLPKK